MGSTHSMAAVQGILIECIGLPVGPDLPEFWNGMGHPTLDHIRIGGA
jgi:hypothetical protein